MKSVGTGLFLMALLGAVGPISPGATAMETWAFQFPENASFYDPYTNGATICPQGGPNGGPKCGKMIPASRSPA